ncbi:MAG TPA: hypothetical protein PLY11_14095 [Syntrophorhabdus sp.]|jgi:hypothetical protein|nr:hypothetical protein [Syntrophorhabdus sp.]
MDTGDKAHENAVNVLEDIAKEAGSTGFIGTAGLAMLLGARMEYSTLLPILWKEYGLDTGENNLIPRRDYDTQKGEDRVAMWYFLLMRWTHSDGGMFSKLRQRVKNLPLYCQRDAGGEWVPADKGRGEYVNLKEFETYIQNEISKRGMRVIFVLPTQITGLMEFKGRAQIIEQFGKRFQIGSWSGVLRFLERKNFSLRHNRQGEKPIPVISETELIELSK